MLSSFCRMRRINSAPMPRLWYSGRTSRRGMNAACTWSVIAVTNPTTLCALLSTAKMTKSLPLNILRWVSGSWGFFHPRKKPAQHLRRNSVSCVAIVNQVHAASPGFIVRGAAQYRGQVATGEKALGLLHKSPVRLQPSRTPSPRRSTGSPAAWGCLTPGSSLRHRPEGRRGCIGDRALR